MEKKTYFNEVANAIKRAGFRVFVKANRPGDLPYYYGYYSDGVNVGYFQLGDFGQGVKYNTVNAPGSFCTGFAVLDNPVNIEDLTPANLRRAFVTVPGWYRLGERQRVYKYRDLADFLARYWDRARLVEI